MQCDAAGNLFVADTGGNIYEYTPGGVRSTVGTGLQQPSGLALQPVPEPALVLLAIGAVALMLRRR